MSTTDDALRKYLAKLGLEEEIADIYLALHSHGPQTISALSRTARVERTRIYRLIDKLLASNLFEVEENYKRGIIRAAPIANLRILIAEREQELKSLQDDLDMVEHLFAKNSLSSPATRVQFYHGPEGIRQMQWNLFRAKSTILSVMHRPMYDITGSTFFERWALRNNSEGYQTHLIWNQEAFISSDKWHTKHPGFKIKGHTTRLLPSKVMSITHSFDIYNEVVAFYNWHKEEVFGVELYNKEIADSQRVFFDMLWNQTVVPPSDIGNLKHQSSKQHHATT